MLKRPPSRFLCVSFALLLAPPPLHAYRVEGLYEAVVPADDQGEASRQRAFREALSQVLVKISATPEAIDMAAS